MVDICPSYLNHNGVKMKLKLDLCTVGDETS